VSAAATEFRLNQINHILYAVAFSNSLCFQHSLLNLIRTNLMKFQFQRRVRLVTCYTTYQFRLWWCWI